MRADTGTTRRAGRHAVRSRCALGVAALVSAVLVPETARAATGLRPATSWGVDGRVSAILPVGDRVFLGGSFANLVSPTGATYPAANLAVLSRDTGAPDTTWTGGTDGTVTTLATDGSRLFVGGAFTHVGTRAHRHLAAVDLADGSLLAGWHATANRVVDALAVAGPWVFVAGSFSTVSDAGGRHARAFLARVSTSDGTVSAGWAPAPDARARALAPSPDGATLFAGGDFSTVDGAASTARVAALSTSTGTVVSTFRSSPNSGKSYQQVFGLTTDGTTVYEAVGGPGGACTAVSAATGARTWSKSANGNLHAVVVWNGAVYCGGHFSGTSSFDGQTRYKLAAVDAATGTTLAFAPRVNSALGVFALGAAGTRLLSGGDFTRIDSVPLQHYVAFADTSTVTVQ